MNPDNLKQAWQSQPAQPRLTIDAALLLRMVQQNHRQFSATIFWRDVREVVVGVMLVPTWLILGYFMALPWTWYLVLPGVVWGFGFIVWYRLRHRRPPPEQSASLRECVQRMLVDVENQIWLLRNVLWWCLLPLTPAMLVFVGHIGWASRHTGWPAATAMLFTGSVIVGVHAWVWWLNQYAIRTQLEPKREELEALLNDLEEEAPAIP